MNPEISLLACGLLSPDALDKAMLAGVQPEWFTEAVTRKLWLAIVARVAADGVVDLPWAGEYLRNNGHKQSDIILTRAFTEIVSPMSEIMSVVEILHTRWLRRQFQEKLTDKQRRIMTDEPELLTTELIEELTELKRVNQTDHKPDTLAVLDALTRGINYKTDYVSWDWATRGCDHPNYVVISGCTHHGKSALMQNMCYNLAKKQIPVTYISSEMRYEAFSIRLATMHCGVNAFLIGQHITPDERLKMDMALEDVVNMPIEFLYTNSLSHVRMAIQKKRTPIYFVDYLQEIKADRHIVKRNEAVAIVTRELEHLSKDYGVHITAASQIDRQSAREGINLYSSKETGEIENSADILATIYYEYQQAISMRDQAKMEKLKADGRDKLVEVSICKNRLYGHYPIIDLHFDRDKLRFSDIKKDEEV